MVYPTRLLMLMLLGVHVAACAPFAPERAEMTQPARQETTTTELPAEITREIDSARAAFGEAYIRQDAKMLAALYHPDAVFAGTLHPYWLEGGDNIQRLWTYYFGTFRNARIFFWSSSYRVLVPKLLVGQHATATMVMPDATGRVHNLHMRLSIIWMKVPEYTVGAQKVQWQIVHMHGSESPTFR
jgi:ketosteroid isomerase-like protein